MMLSYDIITTTWLLITGMEFSEQDTIHVWDRESTTAFYLAFGYSFWHQKRRCNEWERNEQGIWSLVELDLFGHQQKILVIFVSVFHLYLAENGLLRTFPFYCCIFSPHFPFLISSSGFDGPTLISQEDCAGITLHSLRVQDLGVAFCLLGLCMWKSPCCTYYGALLIRCEIKGDFGELKKPIHYVLWSGNAKHQSLTN